MSFFNVKLILAPIMRPLALKVTNLFHTTMDYEFVMEAHKLEALWKSDLQDKWMSEGIQR
jgi:hypothetical protein